MTRRINKGSFQNKRAFTLVELIVVLVILALLAAMLVPALAGYIRRAKKERYYDQAHYALVAAQSIMSELYGKGISYTNDVRSGDIDWQTDDWGDKILSLLGYGRGADNMEPYILIFGVGRDGSVDPALPYTVMFIAYVADANAPAVYYVDGTWTYSYPWENGMITGGNGEKNKIAVGPHAGSQMTLYIVSNRTRNRDITQAAFWTGRTDSLRAHSEGYFNL